MSIIAHTRSETTALSDAVCAVVGPETTIQRIEGLLKRRNVAVIPARVAEVEVLKNIPARLLIVVACMDTMDSLNEVEGYKAFLRAYAKLRLARPFRPGLFVVSPPDPAAEYPMMGYGDLVDAYLNFKSLESHLEPFWDRVAVFLEEKNRTTGSNSPAEDERR